MPARKKIDTPAEEQVEETPVAEQPVEETPAEADAPKERKAKQVGPATQKVIDRILDMRRQGMGYPSIAKTLNDEKVKTFGSGKTWHPPVVRGICLRNGVVKGDQASS